MLSGYALANARRCWYVPDFNVWGTPGWGEFDFVVTENSDSSASILFSSVNIGEGAQLVSYKNLVDFRGNNLPETIKNPRLLVKNRLENGAFIVGTESDNAFKIARSANIPGPVKVDLFIVEMGL